MYPDACETGFGCHGSAGTYCITDDIGVGDLRQNSHFGPSTLL